MKLVIFQEGQNIAVVIALPTGRGTGNISPTAWVLQVLLPVRESRGLEQYQNISNICNL
jgi:hypothetical protein